MATWPVLLGLDVEDATQICSVQQEGEGVHKRVREWVGVQEAPRTQPHAKFWVASIKAPVP